MAPHTEFQSVQTVIQESLRHQYRSPHSQNVNSNTVIISFFDLISQSGSNTLAIRANTHIFIVICVVRQNANQN